MKLAALALVALACSVAVPTLYARYGFRAFDVVVAVEMALYASAAWLVWHRPASRADLWLIVAAALAMRLALVPQRPFLSDDIYRYIWDGRVQAAGINPYRFVPGAPELTVLRDADIFPNINRRDFAPTIYPPAAQIFFLLAGAIGGGLTVMKLLLVAMDTCTVALLARMLRVAGENPSRVILYAWHPLACWEIGHSGHVDALAILLVVGALSVAARRPRQVLAGALLGLATLVKGYPALVAPAFFKRGGLRFCVGFAATFILYIPYASVGPRVFGYLPDYMREEGIDTGDRFALLRAIRLVVPLPTGAFLVLAAVAFLALAYRSVRLPDRGVRGVATDAAGLGGLALVVGTPHYAWYYVWILPFATLSPSVESIWLGTMGTLLYYTPHTPAARLAFEVASDLPLVGALVARRVRRARSPE